MKTLLKLEELALFLGCLYLFSRLSFAWWWFPALLLAPDLSMIGYVVNPTVGAFTYNVAHHRAVGIIASLCGLAVSSQWLILAGIILVAHTSFDRMLGYGLKYPDDFRHTSLGWIGRP